MNKLEFVKIKELAGKANISTAEFMRNSALNQEIKAAITLEEMAHIRALSKLNNNLNQIAKKMHTNGLIQTAKEIDEIIKTLQKIVK